MGEYGIYVWPAFSITLLILLLQLGFAVARFRSLKKELFSVDKAVKINQVKYSR